MSALRSVMPFAGLRLEPSPAVWLLAVFVVVGPFLAQVLAWALAPSLPMSLAMAGGHAIVALALGARAYAKDQGGLSDVPAGSLVGLALAVVTYNLLALVAARLLPA